MRYVYCSVASEHAFEIYQKKKIIHRGINIGNSPQTWAMNDRQRVVVESCLYRLPKAPTEGEVKEKMHIVVNDRMQKGYRYELSALKGRDFDLDFKPELTPKQMLELGVFCGKYMTDTQKEFPESWFKHAKLSPHGRDCSLNYFGVDASQPLSVWQNNGWLHPNDPRGWFQWYCRYYMGRRIPEEDNRQIKRWKAFRRHVSQIRKNCEPGDPFCRPRQRQALLHWAYDSRKI